MCFSSFACPAVFCQSCTDGEERKRQGAGGPGSYRVVVCLYIILTTHTHQRWLAARVTMNHTREPLKRDKSRSQKGLSLSFLDGSLYIVHLFSSSSSTFVFLSSSLLTELPKSHLITSQTRSSSAQSRSNPLFCFF